MEQSVGVRLSPSAPTLNARVLWFFFSCDGFVVKFHPCDGFFVVKLHPVCYICFFCCASY